jgi:hypothetical protein
MHPEIPHIKEQLEKGWLDPRHLAEAENPHCANCGKSRYKTMLTHTRHANQHAHRGTARQPALVLTTLDTPVCQCASPDFSFGEEVAALIREHDARLAPKKPNLTEFFLKTV